jgi:hypothetical protein
MPRATNALCGWSMRICAITVCLCIWPSAFSACSDGAAPPDPAQRLVGRPAPPIISEQWLNTEKPIDLASLKGQVVWVQFCGIWARPCAREAIPKQVTLRPDAGVVPILVLFEGADDLQQRRGQLSAVPRHPTVVNGAAVWEQWGVSAAPTDVLIARDGTVAWVGACTDPEFFDVLRDVVRGAA